MIKLSSGIKTNWNSEKSKYLLMTSNNKISAQSVRNIWLTLTGEFRKVWSKTFILCNKSDIILIKAILVQLLFFYLTASVILDYILFILLIIINMHIIQSKTIPLLSSSTPVIFYLPFLLFQSFLIFLKILLIHINLNCYLYVN